MVYIKLITSLLIAININALSVLKELTSKQNILNVRFMDSATQLTIYKKGNNELKYSANFKAFTLIKSDFDSEFVVKKAHKDNYIIWHIPYANNYLTPLKNGHIYFFNSSLDMKKEIGNGINPLVHYPNNQISYLDISNNSIEIFRIKENLKVASIKLNSRRPYFSPMVRIHNNDVFYTDINDKGQVGLIHLNLATKKRVILYKPSRQTAYFESCLIGQKLYILESSEEEPYSLTYSLEVNNIDFSKRDILFESKNGPSHHLHCSKKNNALFFVTQFKGLTRINTEVAELNLKSKNLIQRSDLNFVTSISMIDDQIAIPYRKKIYLIQNSQGHYFYGPNKTHKEAK